MDQLNQVLKRVYEKIDGNLTIFRDEFPRDASINNIYPAQGVEDGWTQSFWTGMVWLAYEMTGEDRYLELAKHHSELFKYRVDNNLGMETHDIGFLYTLSAVADYKITGSEEAKKTAIKAADTLMLRWKEKGEFIQAWGSIEDPAMYRLITDCYMNLPLLFWATEVTGDKKYAEVARKHAHTARKVVIREDHSTFHTFYFDPKTGAPAKGVTCQGYADDSCWARGQAWAIYGFALCYKYLKEDIFIEEFYKVADYFFTHLPEDKVPYWDLCFTEGNEERDSSSAPIAICGVLEMSKYIKNERMEMYLNASMTMLSSLIEHYTTFDMPEANGLLLHGVYAKPDGKGIDEMQIWGDYYFMESLVRLTNEDWHIYW